MDAICPCHGTVKGAQENEGIESPRANCAWFQWGWSSGSVADSQRAFPGEQPAASDSSWENRGGPPASVSPQIPPGQPLYITYTWTHTQTVI